MFDRIGDWTYNNLGFMALLALIIVIGIIIAGSRSLDNECNDMMKLARSPRDSLEVRIACNNMQSDYARNIAIGAAAGSIASRR